MATAEQPRRGRRKPDAEVTGHKDLHPVVGRLGRTPYVTEQTMETRVALLEAHLQNLERAADKRERLQDERERVQDARHAEAMAKLSALERSLSSGHDFQRGVTATVKVAFAAFGGAVALAGQWLWQSFAGP